MRRNLRALRRLIELDHVTEFCAHVDHRELDTGRRTRLECELEARGDVGSGGARTSGTNVATWWMPNSFAAYMSRKADGASPCWLISSIITSPPWP